MHLPSRPRLLWLQGITCNGDAHSFLNHDNLEMLLEMYDLVHHPLIETAWTLEEVLDGKAACDVLIIDGAIREKEMVRGGVEMYEVITHYAQQAQHIITLGTCATFGGLLARYRPDETSGFCFDGEIPNDRYEQYADKLVALPGCPTHPAWVAYVLHAIARRDRIDIDELHRPRELYSTAVHAGCQRNEYFEWKIDPVGFGRKEGCLFYQHGCQAPYTHGSCNKILWNGISSKTTVGTPCFGCTEPTFPVKNLFATPTNMGIPAKVPLGVSKRAYLTLTTVAKGFHIKRLSRRIIDYDG